MKNGMDIEYGVVNSDIYGYNFDAMDNLILDIYTKMERIKKNLDQMSTIVENCNACFNSVNMDLYNKKYDNFKTNYKNFIDNINYYADNFLFIKKKHDANLSQMLTFIDIEKTELDKKDN